MDYTRHGEERLDAEHAADLRLVSGGSGVQWLEAAGRPEGAWARSTVARRELLYSAIDSSSFYENPVAHDARSWMNVPFTLARPELDKTFLAEAKDAGLVTLEGHRSVGGMRASIYNAMPLAGVEALVSFMKEFERKHSGLEGAAVSGAVLLMGERGCLSEAFVSAMLQCGTQRSRWPLETGSACSEF